MLAYAHNLFFFNDTATTEIYTLSLHDALPISLRPASRRLRADADGGEPRRAPAPRRRAPHTDGWPASRTVLVVAAQGLFVRSEEHTSELQSQSNLVCRLLLEKKKTTISRSTLR